MFADFYEALFPSIVSVLTGRFNVPLPIAQELVQDAAINCWRAETERGIKVMPGYWMRAAYSRMYDMMRKNKGTTVLSMTCIDPGGDEFERQLPHEMPQYFDKENVEEILRRLTPLQARVAVLRFYGFTHAEIAAMLPNMSADASKKLIARAKGRTALARHHA